jgi:hypothetical protein
MRERQQHVMFLLWVQLLVFGINIKFPRRPIFIPKAVNSNEH